jgi:hypothetical protein
MLVPVSWYVPRLIGLNTLCEQNRVIETRGCQYIPKAESTALSHFEGPARAIRAAGIPFEAPVKDVPPRILHAACPGQITNMMALCNLNSRQQVFLKNCHAWSVQSTVSQ